MHSLEKDLQKISTPARAKANAWFFKTGKGEYGEGDTFFGVTVPETRAVAKKYVHLPLLEVEKLLLSPIHEVRLASLLILVEKYAKGTEKERDAIYNFYLKHSSNVNNWDLVDLSAHKIVGVHLQTKSRKRLYALAKSKNIWQRRIAIISTFYFIKQKQFSDSLKIAAILLHDSHDLIQKAVGWMLREVGKQDEKVLVKFLKKNYKEMPRTMLRYAIEKFPEAKRKKYLNGEM